MSGFSTCVLRNPVERRHIETCGSLSSCSSSVFGCTTNDVVFNGARPDVEAIRARIREEYSGWHLARLYHSNSFGFEEPVSWIDGE
jgi:hypothetical protein